MPSTRICASQTRRLRRREADNRTLLRDRSPARSNRASVMKVVPGSRGKLCPFHIALGGCLSYSSQRMRDRINLFCDANALINNPRIGRENDAIWTAKTNKIPAVNTSVNLTIQLSHENLKNK